MSEAARFPGAGGEAGPASPGLTSEQMRRLVEDIARVLTEAVGSIRTMQQESERSRALAEQYREQCARQHLAFEDEVLAIEERYLEAREKLEGREAALEQLREIAEMALQRYREAEAWGHSALERAESAELRAARAEQGLATLLSVMEGRLRLPGRAGGP